MQQPLFSIPVALGAAFFKSNSRGIVSILPGS